MTDQPTDDKTHRTEAQGAAGAQPARPEPTPDVKAAAKPVAAETDAKQPGARGQARPPRPSRAASAAAAAQAADASEAAVTSTAPAAKDTGREALRGQWQNEARVGTSAHDKQVRRFLLRLSLLNWAIAIVAWTVSAALGITSPASIIVYSVLFVIGLVAAILAILTYLLEKFGHEAEPVGAISGNGGGGTADDTSAAAKGDTSAPAAT
jgi:hypothetical protein